MPLSEIPLPRIKITSMREAAIGALLQIGHGESPAAFAVLRCVWGNDFKGFVFLESDLAGTFEADQSGYNVPAIDIGDLSCVVVSDAAPANIRTRKLAPGAIYQVTDSDGVIFRGVAVIGHKDDQGRDHIGGYVRLEGEQRGHVVEKASSPVYLGMAKVLPVPLKLDKLLQPWNEIA